MGILGRVANIISTGTKSLNEAITYSPLLQSFYPSRNGDIQSLTALYRGVQAISDSCAQIEWEINQKENKSIDPNLEFLLNIRPNPYTSSFTLWHTAVNKTLINGDAFIYIERDSRTSKPMALYMIHNDVKPTVKVYENDRITYDFGENHGGEIAAEDVLHIRFDVDELNEFLGTDITKRFRRALSIAASADGYAESVYKNNGNISGVLETDKMLKDEQVERLRASWKDRYNTKSESTVILEGGMKFRPISINPSDSKFLEARKFQISEVARILGVPMFVLAEYEGYKYGSMETAELDFYKRSIAPKITAIEEEITIKLLTDRRVRLGARCTGNAKKLLRTDTATRMAYYKELFYLGAITPEEIRKDEGRTTLDSEGMDKTYIQANLIPSDKIDSFYENKENPSPNE